MVHYMAGPKVALWNRRPSWRERRKIKRARRIVAVVRNHHVRIGIMESPGHRAYEAARRDGGKWFASCISDSRGGEIGCGWDSKPYTFESRDMTWLAAAEHVAEAVSKEAL